MKNYSAADLWLFLDIAQKLGFKNFQSSDSILERTIRFYLGEHRFTAIPALKGEVGWSKTRSDRSLSMICYWNRLINISTSRLTHKIFECDYKLLEENANWSSEIMPIMNDNGFENLFLIFSVILK